MTDNSDMLKTEWDAAPPDDWDAYVGAHPDGHAFQTAGAVLIGNRAFGLPVYFVTARDNGGQLRGVLPLVEQTLIPWSRCLVSLPFCTYGGPLADNENALSSLIQAIEQIAQLRRADRIIIRHVGDKPGIPYPASLDKVSMVLTLPGSKDELGRQLGSKLRSQIRRSDREHPLIVLGHAELLDDFFTVFCSVMRDLGTPVYPRRFFEEVLKGLGDRASIMMVYLGDAPVSGAMMVRWRDSVKVPWAATLHSVNPMAINMRLYWELLSLAIDRGCAKFDFGRCTRNAGTYRFKAQWGAQPVQLYWRLRNLGSVGSVTAVLDNRSQLEKAVKIWRRLPLWVTNSIGPYVSPRLPW